MKRKDNIIIIKVAEGTSKLYYLQSKGLSYLEVFVMVDAFVLNMCSRDLIEKVGRGKEKYYKLLK